MFFLDGSVFEQLGHGWKLYGIVKILVIIATLQIVKKLPEIINMIFGTNIKDRGGIKGRLGEMAGIGGIAQKAWTSLGTGAKNLAKLGLQAPVAGAYLGANAWYKKHHDGANLKDSQLFRQGKGLVYGVRGGLRKGSLLDAWQEYDKASAPPVYSTSERVQARDLRNKATANAVSKAIGGGERVDSSGNKFQYKEMFTPDGGVKGSFRDAAGNEHFFTENDWKKGKEAFYKQYDQYGAAGGFKKAAAMASEYKSHLQGVQDKRKEAYDNLYNFANDPRVSKNIAEYAGNLADGYFKKGKKLTAEDRKFLEDNRSNSYINTALEAITKASNGEAYLVQNYDGSNGQIKFDGQVGKIALGNSIAAQDTIINTNNSQYKAKEPTISVVDQDAIASLDAQNEESNLKMNGCIQNNSVMSAYLDNSGNFNPTKPVPSSYLTDMVTGVIKPNYTDYKISEDKYDAFDTFVQSQSEQGVNMGTAQFATALKTEISNPTSDLYNATNNNVVDFVTNICDDPSDVLGKIRGIISDEKEFGTFLDSIEPTVKNSGKSTKFAIEIGKLDGGKWYKDPATKKWVKRP